MPVDLMRSRHKRVGVLAAWLLAGIGLLVAPALAAAGEDDDDALGTKLAGYVYCINGQTGSVMRSRKYYFMWLQSPAKGPTGREPAVTGVSALDDTQRCLDRIAEANRLPPAIAALERSAESYAQSLAAAEAVLREAHEYYALGNYKDDGMRQGKALHPRLVEAYSNFEAASDQLYAEVVALQDAISERRLQRLSQEPQLRGEFLIEQVTVSAKQVIDRAEGIADKDFPAAPFAAAVDALERSWREIDAFRKANPDYPNSGIRHSSLTTAAFDLLKSARAAQRRQRDGFRFDDSDTILIEAKAAQLVDGHPVQLIEKYNAVVDAANSARR